MRSLQQIALELAVLVASASLACLGGLYLWSLRALDKDAFAWGLVIFFPWREPSAALLFFPLLKWGLSVKRIPASRKTLIIAGLMFGFPAILSCYLLPAFSSDLARFIAQFASQSIFAMTGVTLARAHSE